MSRETTVGIVQTFPSTDVDPVPAARVRTPLPGIANRERLR